MGKSSLLFIAVLNAVLFLSACAANRTAATPTSPDPRVEHVDATTVHGEATVMYGHGVGH